MLTVVHDCGERSVLGVWFNTDVAGFTVQLVFLIDRPSKRSKMNWITDINERKQQNWTKDQHSFNSDHFNFHRRRWDISTTNHHPVQAIQGRERRRGCLRQNEISEKDQQPPRCPEKNIKNGTKSVRNKVRETLEPSLRTKTTTNEIWLQHVFSSCREGNVFEGKFRYAVQWNLAVAFQTGILSIDQACELKCDNVW